MDISKDQLRRDRQAVEAAQADALPKLRQLLNRVLDGSSGGSAEDRADALSGGVSRRKFLAIGGFSVATAAVIAACGPDNTTTQIPQGGQLPTTTALAKYDTTDLALVRTASSLEYNLVDAYNALASLDTVSPEALEVMTLFASQHREHAAVFEKAAEDLGGKAFRRANPIFYKNVIEPGLEALAAAGNSAQAVYRFAHGLETVAGATYQQVTPVFTVPELRSAANSVGAVEAMHSALWVPFIDEGAVSPVLVQAAAAAQGSTTAPATPTSLPVYMVPAAFGQVDPVDIQLGQVVDSIDLPGPNSFMYPELGE